VTVWPADVEQPYVSNLNVLFPGQTVANQVVVPVSGSGAVKVFTSVGTELVADVDGYFTAVPSASAGSYEAQTPATLMETRGGSQTG
jgi:hypothetical protein